MGEAARRKAAGAQNSHDGWAWRLREHELKLARDRFKVIYDGGKIANNSREDGRKFARSEALKQGRRMRKNATKKGIFANAVAWLAKHMKAGRGK